MESIKSISGLMVVIACFFTISCLDVQPKGILELDNLRDKEENINLMIDGMYSILADSRGFKSHATNLRLFLGDDIYSNGGIQGQYSDRTFDASTQSMQIIYPNFFEVINAANNILAISDNPLLDSVFVEFAKGNAHFVRGLTYFHLVRLWGPSIIREQPFDLEANPHKPRSSVEEVYQFVLEDMKIASKMPFVDQEDYSNSPATGFGNANPVAALGYLAKVSLHYGNYLDLAGKSNEAKLYYNEAIKWAEATLTAAEGTYKLVPDYATLWDVTREAEARQEVLFGIPYTMDPVNANGVGSELGNYLRPFGSYRVQPWWVERMWNDTNYRNDRRFQISTPTFGIHPSNGREYAFFPRPKEDAPFQQNINYCGKYIDDTNAGRNKENDLPLLRLSEIYLILAEATNEVNGPNQDAINAINIVRDRARFNGNEKTEYPGDVNLDQFPDKESLRMFLFTERNVELFAEGHRYYDLLRMKSPDGTSMFEYRFTQVLNNLEAGLPKYNNREGVWEGGRIQTGTAFEYNPRFLLLPIPTDELINHENIQQNPGW